MCDHVQLIYCTVTGEVSLFEHIFSMKVAYSALSYIFYPILELLKGELEIQNIFPHC